MTGLIPPTEVAAHFAAEATSAGAARRFLAATLRAWQLDPLEEVASLLVSELVSNALLHAGTDLDVHVRRVGGKVRVEVHDRSPRLPERKHYSPTSVTGRGLLLVAELSEAWGAERTADGKAVWFELDEEAPPAVAQPVMGAEFRLDDWEDWDDLAPASASSAPIPGAETSTGSSPTGNHPQPVSG